MRRFVLMYLCFLFYDATYAEENPALACIKQLVTEPKFAAITNKLPLGDIQDISFQMLANRTMPTKKESALIVEWIEAKKNCFAIGLEYANKNYPPQIIPLITEANNQVITVVASLYNKEFTYGSANKQIQSIADDYVKKLVAVTEQIKNEKMAQQDKDRRIEEQQQEERNIRQQQQQAREDAQNRQLAVQILMNNMNNNNQIPLVPYQMPVHRNVQTICNQSGTSVICNSH